MYDSIARFDRISCHTLLVMFLSRKQLLLLITYVFGRDVASLTLKHYQHSIWAIYKQVSISRDYSSWCNDVITIPGKRSALVRADSDLWVVHDTGKIRTIKIEKTDCIMGMSYDGRIVATHNKYRDSLSRTIVYHALDDRPNIMVPAIGKATESRKVPSYIQSNLLASSHLLGNRYVLITEDDPVAGKELTLADIYSGKVCQRLPWGLLSNEKHHFHLNELRYLPSTNAESKQIYTPLPKCFCLYERKGNGNTNLIVHRPSRIHNKRLVTLPSEWQDLWNNAYPGLLTESGFMIRYSNKSNEMLLAGVFHDDKGEGISFALPREGEDARFCFVVQVIHGCAITATTAVPRKTIVRFFSPFNCRP